MTNKTYKKLIVFDINIDWKDSNDSKKHQDIDVIFSLLKIAQEKQKIVIQTSAPLKDSLIFLDENKITTGYLIASGGSIIYDISKKKILNCYPLTKDEAKAVIHHGIMSGVNVAIFTKDEKYLYVANTVAYDCIKNSCYCEYKQITSYSEIDKIISSNDIIDVGLFLFNVFVNNDRQKQIIDNISKFWENEINTLSIKTNKTSKFVHFGNSQATKNNALNVVMSYENLKNNDDVLYIAGTCIDRQCVEKFKNILLSSTVNFINEIADFSGDYIADKAKKLDPDFGAKTNSFWK